MVQLELFAPNMPLPAIDSERINVSAEDSITFANGSALSLPEGFWKAEAAPLLAGK